MPPDEHHLQLLQLLQAVQLKLPVHFATIFFEQHNLFGGLLKLANNKNTDIKIDICFTKFKFSKEDLENYKSNL